jgi:hypothetical protein
MAAGDVQRVWFPEMLEALASTWSVSMTWEELADFCQRMTEERRAIRRSRGIQSPRTRCPKCGVVSQSDIAGVTIRSARFALKKAGKIGAAEFEEMDKRWRKHRATHRLDAFGRRTGPTPDASSDTPTCCR